MSRRLYILILFLFGISPLAIAFDGNLDGDCIVNFADFARFAADWKKIDPNISDPNADYDSDGMVDCNDLGLLSGYWLTQDPNNLCDERPTAGDITVNCLTYADIPIELDGSDTGESPLTYQVTSLPSIGTLYDANGITEINSVPYDLSGNSVIYYSEIPSSSLSFKYKCYDGESYSSEATVILNVDGVPLAYDVNFTGYELYRHKISLSGLSYSGDLQYVITGLPDSAYLFDPAVSAGILDANRLPHFLYDNDCNVVFLAAEDANYSFEYKTYDGRNYSQAATVTVNIQPNPMDALNFDGNTNPGYLIVPDKNEVDLFNGWGMAFYINTRTSDWVIAKKRNADAGWEIGLEDGMPYMEFFKNGNSLGRFKPVYDLAMDDGCWWHIGFSYNGSLSPNVNINYTQFDYIAHDSDEFFDSLSEDTLVAPVNDYSNDANLIINIRKGSIDRLEFYSGSVTNAVDFGFVVAMLDRRDVASVGGWATTPQLRWQMDEGTGSTIVDQYKGYEAYLTDTNLVRWVPYLDTRNYIEKPNPFLRDCDSYNFVNFNNEKTESKDKFGRER